MLKIYCTALAVLCAGGVVYSQDSNAQQAPRPVQRAPKGRINSPEYKISNIRIDKIKSLLESKYAQKVKLPEPAVRRSIENELTRLVPLQPKEKADTRSYLDIKKALEGKINAKYSADLNEIRKKAEGEFDAKNPLAERNKDVTVRYKRGGSTYRFSGRYYGFGLGGTTIRLNSRNIPLIDLTPESLIRFDPKYHAAERKKYADEAVRKYIRAKNFYADKIISEEYAKVRKKNEKLGYILRNGWEPAKKIVDEYYEDLLVRYKVREEEEAQKRAEALKNNPVQLLPKKDDSEEEEEEEE